MKTADDFRRALGEGDEGFHRRVQATLAALPEEEPVVKKKMSVGLAIAFALLMMTMVAAVAANWWGIGDFLNRNDLGELTVDSAFAAETTYATFTVTEHIYDGRGVYFVLAVQPMEEKTMLLPAGTPKSSPMGYLLSDLGVWDITCEDYAAEHGFEQIRWVAFSLDRDGKRMNNIPNNTQQRLQADGSLVMMVYALVDEGPETLNFTVTCGSHISDVLYNNWWEKPRVSVQRMDVTFQKNDTSGKTWRSAEPVIFEDVGMTVEEVCIVEGAMIDYFTIDYTVHDISTGSRWMYLSNAEGQVRGHGNDVWCMQHFALDADKGRFRWLGTVKLTDKILESFYIRATKGQINFPDAKEIKEIRIIPAE